MFEGSTLRISRSQDGIATLCFDRAGQSVNKLDRATLGELNTALELLRRDSGLRGVLVTSAKDAFIVGADIFEFLPLFSRPEAEIVDAIAADSALFTAFADLPVPTVAAINGLALGGGFEMALACDARVMASTARVGLPEVTLGIFPGYGGCVRLPRLAGLAKAARWIVDGKQQKAEEALTSGAVDAICSPASLQDEALGLLRQAIAADFPWQERRRQLAGPVAAADAAELAPLHDAADRAAGHFPAAKMALDLMSQTAGCSRDDALARESAAFGSVAKTHTASSLVGLFTNEQVIRKKAKGYAAAGRTVRRAGVLGAGIMGGGIAYTSAISGTPVVLKDIRDAALEQGMAEARKLLGKQVARGRLTEPQSTQLLTTITPTLDYEPFGATDMVVEAVVENLKIKQQVLTEAERECDPGTLIASNTSSLSIAELAKGLQRPQNFLGMHFFNPVPVMPLVEVIRGPATSEHAVATVAAWAAGMGKSPIVVQDCPGFLVNRILIAYFCGWLRLIRDGADYVAVDRTLAAFGWPMGPALLLDVIGMDTGMHVVDIISSGYGERMRLDFRHAVAALAEDGMLGQKSGQGFYRHRRDGSGALQREPSPAAARRVAEVQPHGQRPFSDKEIVERTMLPLLVEAALCHEERIADTPAEIDMALIMGLGFPRHLGGPLRYADWLGLAQVVERCQAYATLGSLYQPGRELREMAAADQRYHPLG